MSDQPNKAETFGETSRRVAKGICSTGSNRLALLAAEFEEERDHLLHGMALGILAAMFSLLAVMALSAATVFMFWSYSPLAVLLGLALLHGTIAMAIFQQLSAMRRDWKSFASTLGQLQKDFQCLEKSLN